ncbi:Tn3 family transposase [Nonomuraea pusilla]|uniref:Tn3 family transposase n=1 Tax=Nonomuraea pusilla TaxID=46177 RepID=UPI00331DE55B
MRRTVHAARYLSDPVYRRKISRQLNKGESLHALRRDLHYGSARGDRPSAPAGPPLPNMALAPDVWTP